MSIDGTWNVTLHSPICSQEGTLTLATDGDTLTGTLSGPQGAMDIEDGQVGDGSYSWKVNITSPMAITIESTATVDGDTITGASKLGAFGTATFTGTRA